MKLAAILATTLAEGAYVSHPDLGDEMVVEDGVLVYSEDGLEVEMTSAVALSDGFTIVEPVAVGSVTPAAFKAAWERARVGFGSVKSFEQSRLASALLTELQRR